MTAVSLYAWDSVNNVFVKVGVDASGYIKNVLANLEKAEDAAHSSGDKGIMILGVRKDDITALSGTDGDYTPLILNEDGILRTQAQQHIHIEECGATTGWTVLGDDTTNLATTTNHVFGALALEFDKVNGSDDTIFAGIQKTLTSIDLTPYHKGGGFFLAKYYISSLSDVSYIFLRLGTDSSNYNEWQIGVDSLSVGWNSARYPMASPDAIQGNGWNSASITYVAIGVAFSLQNNTLADIAVDHISANTGLFTSADIAATISSEVSSPNINLLKVGNKVVNAGAGNVGTGTQRTTIADDDTNLSAIKTAIEKIDDLQAALKSVDTDELITRITNSSGVEINPAKEDGNLASIKTAVEKVKTETDWTENQTITFDNTTPGKASEGVGSIDLATNGYKKVIIQIQIVGGANWDGNAEIRVRSSSNSGTARDTILFYSFEVTYTASATKRVSFELNELPWVQIGVFNGNATAEDITISGIYAALKYKRG